MDVRHIFAAAAATALAASAVAAEDACPAQTEAPDAQLGAEIDPIVQTAVEDGFAGGVAIIHNGALVYSRVAGISAGETAVTDETRFHVASITKYLTALLTLKAEEDGRLSLDDALSDHLPEMNLAARGIAVSDLLAHRSGLGSSYAAESTYDAEEAIKAIDAAPVDNEKAGSFKYSNDGYDLLAVILERVYGEPYEQIARENILAPLCLEDAGFWGETDLTDPAVVGQPLEAVSAELRQRNYGMLGSAGFLVTARDLARLQSAVVEGRLLAEASVKDLFAPRGPVSIGQATYGAFLMQSDALGPYTSARGFEDWGDNAVLNHYRNHDLIVAVVTSKGPAEGAGDAFRDRISKEIEKSLGARRD